MGIFRDIYNDVANRFEDKAAKAYEEPLLLNKKSDGTCIVHERSGFLPSMDAVSYSAEKFDQKYGGKVLRTLEEYKDDLTGIPSRRAELLQKAEKIFNGASEYGLTKWHMDPTRLDSPTYLLEMQNKVGLVEPDHTNREIYGEVESLRTQSLKLEEVEVAMGLRLREIDKDVRGHGFKLDGPAR